MWKKSLHNSAQISAKLTRAATSMDNYPTLMQFLGKPQGRTFHSARGLILPASSRIFLRDHANSSLRTGNLVCSLSKSVEMSHCWNCGAQPENTTPFLFCPACRSVQPVNETIDYFQIFGIGREYTLQLDKLEKKYKDWQKKLHPDLAHSKSLREREYAAEQSARVIDAYRTLSDPLSRAIYILKLEGVLVDEEERITDPELLAEIMELREAVDEADDTRALNQIQAQLQEKLRHVAESFEDSYKNKNLEEALASICRMTYYKRANEEIVKKA